MTGDEIRLARLKFRYKDYYKNYSLLLTLGFIWWISAYIGVFEVHLSIFALFLGCTLFRPILYITTKILRVPKIHKDESLKLLTKLIIIGILFGLTAGFFPFIENVNLFYPWFAVLFGLIFIGIFVSTGLKVYAIVAMLMMCGGIYCSYYYPHDFSICGYYSSYVMGTFGILSGIYGKHVKLNMSYLKAKLKKGIGTVTFNSPKSRK